MIEDRQNQFKTDSIVISSAWLHGIAFQIIPSHSNLFNLPIYEGFVPPCESRKIPITFDPFAANRRNLKCSFVVNIAQISERDQLEDHPKLFWRRNTKFFSKTLNCEVNFRETFGNPSAAAESDLETDNISFPRGHILELMIKNVSKDNRLTSDEAEVLPSAHLI
jgi:hypothetical protein